MSCSDRDGAGVPPIVQTGSLSSCEGGEDRETTALPRTNRHATDRQGGRRRGEPFSPTESSGRQQIANLALRGSCSLELERPSARSKAMECATLEIVGVALATRIISADFASCKPFLWSPPEFASIDDVLLGMPWKRKSNDVQL